MAKVNPEHKGLLDTIRDLYVQSDGGFIDQPDYELQGGLGSKSGSVVYFQNGLPYYLCVPEGHYVILGSYSADMGTAEKFHELFKKTFKTRKVQPTFKVSCATLPGHPTGGFSSGPCLKILEKRVLEK